MAFDIKKVQGDLIQIGYLPKGSDDGIWGNGSKRALKRFKRRAATSAYRINSATKAAADCPATEFYTGLVDDAIDEATVKEIEKWVLKKWAAPLGRFKFKSAGGATLREDVADGWQKFVTLVKGLGGTLDGPYGDSKRHVGKATKVGASSFSFHISGRAVDINQGEKRYHLAKDFGAAGNFFRLYCKTEKQDGTQGTKYEKDKLNCWSFWSKAAYFAPAGCYLDISAEVTKNGDFERIPAHTGWESNTNKSEWWHFQWKADKQATFEDECELVGISSQDLKTAGYSNDDMDKRPG